MAELPTEDRPAWAESLMIVLAEVRLADPDLHAELAGAVLASAKPRNPGMPQARGPPKNAFRELLTKNEKNYDYRRFLLGQVVSWFGTSMLRTALDLAVVALGGTGALGWVLAAQTLPGVVLSAYAGVLARTGPWTSGTSCSGPRRRSP